MDSIIRWKKGDYLRLYHATKRFNKMISNLENEAIDYLPEKIDYTSLKQNIFTRSELTRTLNSLKRANETNLRNTRSFESGEVLSEWEYKELNKAKRRASLRIDKEAMSILTSRPSIGMGDERLSELRAIDESFNTLPERKGKDFERLKDRIFYLGRKDYDIKKAETYRQNFYTALEGAKNFKHYKELKKELDKIKNPLKFYEYVKKSPFLLDIFLWYKNIETVSYGGFGSNEEAFDTTLMFHLGIELGT